MTAEKKQVLVLHSYHQGLEWTDSISKGIQCVFAPLEKEVEVYFEYLDSKRIFKDSFSENFKILFEHSLKDIRFHVVIVADNNALKFVVDNRELYFKNLPIVFCGINNFKESHLRGETGITGVVENTDLEGTLKLMKKIHPLRKRILVINDQTTTGLANKKLFADLLPHWDKKYPIEYLDEFAVEDLIKRLQELPPEYMVYLLSLNRDSNQNYFSYADAIQIVSQNTTVPVYGSWSFYVGKGITGGVITSGFDQGHIAAEVALKILRGTSVSTIPVIWDCPTRVVFDYNLISAFGIDLGDLPENAIIINQPPSFLQKYYMEFFLIFCFSLLVILFLIIVMQIRRKQRIKLEQVNKGLDRKVEMRTRQLEEVNKSLILMNEEISTNADKLVRQEELTRLAYLRLKAVLNNSLVGILAVDSKRNIIDTNYRFCEIMGYEMEELIGESVGMFYPSYEAYEDFGKMYLTRQREEKYVKVEHQLKRKNGGLIWCQMFGSALDARDLEHGFIWVVDDITDQREAHFRLEESEKALRHANATKDRFFSIIAHDLKNPVNAILGLSKFLAEKRKTVDESTQNEFINDLHTASMNMQALLEDLLTWGRLQIGGVSYRPETMDLKIVTDQAINGILNMAKAKKIKVANLIEGPCWVHADENMITTVIRNLLNNAIKFTYENGKVEVDVLISDSKVEVSVCDTGIGISAKELPYLFDIGKKIQHPGTQEEEGTGLGLLLCKEFVIKNGGEIWAKSEEGKGSCFHFSLPLAE
ncbi:MAG: ABC transporter substrate binding protein [Marinifilaceae bacterium]